MYEYIIKENDIFKRGIYLTKKEINKRIINLKTNKAPIEAYRSYFGYEGNDLYLSKIILDIDNHNTKSEKDEKDLMNTIKNISDKLISDYDLSEQFQLWFSGRGFHFHIPNIFAFTKDINLPAIVKSTLSEHFPEADLMPINPKGIIRLPYSYNSKSNLYKIPILEDEIWELELKDIKELAKNKRNSIKLIIPDKYNTYPEKIILPKNLRTFQIHKSVRVEGSHKKILRNNFSNNKPNRFVICCQNMYNKGAEKGHRHERLMRIASWLRLRGLPKRAVLDVVMGYMNGEGGDKEVKLVNNIFDKEYEYSCSDNIMQEFCDSNCAFYKSKNYLTELVTADEIENEFANFILSDWKQNSIDFSKILGINTEWWISPQDVVGFIGASGINKTALLQNISIQLKDFSPVLYISTEFSNPLLIRRFAQIAHNMTKEEVIRYYEKGKHIKNPLSDRFSFIKFVNSTPTYEGLEDLIRKYKPRVLIIDVIGDIISKGKRGTEGESIIGQGLKDLGRRYNHFTFYVNHISKSAAYDVLGEPKRLNLLSGKGSSTIAQKSDIVFAIEGKQKDNFRLLRCLKGRDNPIISLGFEVNMDTFRFKRNLNVNDILFNNNIKVNK